MEKEAKVYLSNEKCRKTGKYKFFNCDGEKLSTFQNYNTGNRILSLVSLINECRPIESEIHLKKGELFPGCPNCSNIVFWIHLKKNKSVLGNK